MSNFTKKMARKICAKPNICKANFSNLVQRTYLILYQPHMQLLLKFLFVAVILFACGHAYAVGDDDYLKDTDKGLKATIKGTGKTYVYIGEGIAAIIGYITTKKISMFFGILIIAIFFDVLFHFAGY
ncbi:hypothetical protein BH10PSE19_BH10PSE19_00190 [soil metagenome]